MTIRRRRVIDVTVTLSRRLYATIVFYIYIRVHVWFIDKRSSITRYGQHDAFVKKRLNTHVVFLLNGDRPRFKRFPQWSHGVWKKSFLNRPGEQTVGYGLSGLRATAEWSIPPVVSLPGRFTTFRDEIARTTRIRASTLLYAPRFFFFYKLRYVPYISTASSQIKLLLAKSQNYGWSFLERFFCFFFLHTPLTLQTITTLRINFNPFVL